MNLKELTSSCAAYRTFTDRAVSDEELYRILDVARYAPSGGNRQGWRVVVVKDQVIREKIRDLYVLSWREYMAHVKLGLVPFAPVTDRNWSGPAVDISAARSIEHPYAFADDLDRAPVLLAVFVELGMLAVLDNGLGRQSIVGGASIYPFCYNILLAAVEIGLGGVMTTALCREELAVMSLLGVDPNFALAALLVIGEPAKKISKLTRRSVADFSRIDAFDGERFGESLTTQSSEEGPVKDD